MTYKITTIPTKPYNDQKPGTSGLRKPTKQVMEGNYVQNFIQSIFLSVPQTELVGSTLVLSGDGRYYNNEVIQIVCKMAAANGVKRLWIGENGTVSTPAVSCIIREREGGCAYGGIILTASHNPGGPNADFGIKFNTSNGGPALEKITDAIFNISKSITDYKIVLDLPLIDITKIGRNVFDIEGYGEFIVEIISSTQDYINMLNKIFDFDLLKKLIHRKDFVMNFDAMYGVSGVYAKPIFHDILGVSMDNLHHITPKPDFNGGHPDPNLTYCHDLVKIMGLNNKGVKLDNIDESKVPDFGAACDGDADRAMMMGKCFFVSPSDSVSIVSDFADKCVPYFKSGLKAVARSMPTSSALDQVSKKHNIELFETPTGWKFFGNIMDSKLMGGNDYHPVICGEESFGLGSDHIREKDGIFAILCWLSILAYHNQDDKKPLISIEQIVFNHWVEFGRYFYSRYDYEGITTESANNVILHLNEQMNNIKIGSKIDNYEVKLFDDFCYNDKIDKTTTNKQGIRIIFTDGSRIIYRLSGTGSVGATIRIYFEKYIKDSSLFKLSTGNIMNDLINLSLKLSKLEEFTGRKEPTVIT